MDTREAYKMQADKKSTEPKPFKIGDHVYLSAHYLQSLQPLKKLGPKFVGPFPIKRIINPLTVELELSKSPNRIHPVFHYSLLKPEVVLPIRPTLPPPPAPLMVQEEQHFEIHEILDSHSHRRELQYLVTWKDFSKAENEWVNDHHVRAPRLIKCFHNQYLINLNDCIQ